MLSPFRPDTFLKKPPTFGGPLTNRPLATVVASFGDVYISLHPPDSSQDRLREAMQIVVTVWNAVSLSTSPWNRPQYLRSLLSSLEDPKMGEPLQAVIRTLVESKQTRFNEDTRLVGAWDVAPDGRGGFRFRCEVRGIKGSG